jgi:tetratricopeptide (TPR) repeat protein
LVHSQLNKNSLTIMTFRLRCLCFGAPTLVLLLVLFDSAMAADAYEQSIQRATATLYALDYDRAAAEFEEAISVQPQNPRAYLYLASCYWMKILYLQNKFLSTLFAMPADPYGPLPNDSYPPQLQAQFEEAIRRMKEKSEAMIQAQPKRAEGYFWLGMAEGSEGVFTIAIERKLFAAKAHADKSFDLMEQAAKLDPEFHDPFFSMGMHMHLLGTRGFLTRMLLKMMGYKVSKEEGRRYVKLAAEESRYVRDDARLGLILCYVREGDWKEAVSTMQMVLKRYPQDSLLAVAMARLQSANGDSTGAVTTYRQILQRMEQRHPGYQVLSKGEIQLRLALALLASGQKQEAVAEAEQAVKDPAASLVVRAAANLPLGQARDLLQNRQGAIAAYQAVLGLEPVTPSHEKAREYLNHPYDGRVPAG